MPINRKLLSKFILSITVAVMFSSCKSDNLEVTNDVSNYPPEISAILVNRCATSGCHTDQSKMAAGGISFETWNKMFEGGRGGAVVIPYSTDFSTMLYVLNTDSTLGLALQPTMPYNSSPLSKEEYLLVKDWVERGAPDKNGFVKFSDDAIRQKFFVANKGADAISVFDAQSGLAMQYLDAGISGDIEIPQMVKISPDNEYLYIIFFAGSVVQKFRVSDQSYSATANVGLGNWSSIAISSDSKTGYVVETGGLIAVVDLESMTVVETWTGFANAKGSALNKTDDTLYVTSKTGNYIYKIPVKNNSSYQKISINPSELPSDNPALDPHAIVFTSDFSRYFISCQRSNEVRVLNTSNDSLLAVIPTSEFPVEMVLSSSKPYLFVTCMTAVNPGITILGRVEVIDIDSYSILHSIVPGHNPFGIVVSDKYNKVFVGNRNSTHGGPVPHHSTPLGKNGYITAIDLNTLNLIPGFKTEVSVDPYSIVISR
jgi:DNA-binding beta-propeller fold protein YncE